MQLGRRPSSTLFGHNVADDAVMVRRVDACEAEPLAGVEITEERVRESVVRLLQDVQPAGQRVELLAVGLHTVCKRRAVDRIGRAKRVGRLAPSARQAA